MQARTDLDNSIWEPELPPVDGCKYLLDFLFEAGPLLYSDMGTSPLTWVEIDKWADGANIELGPWERAVVHGLSMVYFFQLHSAEKRTCPTPWQEEEGRPLNVVARGLRATIEGLAKL